MLKKIVMKLTALRTKKKERVWGEKIVTQYLIFLLYFLSKFEDLRDKRLALLELNI